MDPANLRDLPRDPLHEGGETLFLAGNDASVVSEGVLILLGYTILFLILTTWTLRKRVE